MSGLHSILLFGLIDCLPRGCCDTAAAAAVLLFLHYFCCHFLSHMKYACAGDRCCGPRVGIDRFAKKSMTTEVDG